MYLEIHPYYYDSAANSNATRIEQKTPWVNFYKKGNPVVIKLDTIKQIRLYNLYDNSGAFMLLSPTENHEDDIYVSIEEGQKIKNTLLAMEDPVVTILKEISQTLKEKHNGTK